MLRKLLIGGAATVVVLAAGGWGYMQLVKGAYLPYNKYDRRARGTISVGDTAPDVALKMYDGGDATLSELWKTKPLFLVFGSCT